MIAARSTSLAEMCRANSCSNPPCTRLYEALIQTRGSVARACTSLRSFRTWGCQHLCSGGSAGDPGEEKAQPAQPRRGACNQQDVHTGQRSRVCGDLKRGFNKVVRRSNPTQRLPALLGWKSHLRRTTLPPGRGATRPACPRNALRLLLSSPSDAVSRRKFDWIRDPGRLFFLVRN